MKKIIYIICIALMLVVFNKQSNAAEANTEEGTKSIFYKFHGLSELSVDNSYIGVQYLFADKMGFWAELGVNILSDKPSEDKDGEATTNFGLNVGYIYYMFQKGPVAVYVSPFAGFGLSSWEDKDAATTDKVSTTALTVGASVGCEWWFTDGLSLTVATGFGYYSSTTKTENDGPEVETSHSAIGILQGYSHFILSFDF